MSDKKGLIVFIIALVVIVAGTIIFLTMDKTEQEVTYTVSFANSDGTVIATQKIADNTKLSMPNSPTKEGYVFIGWTYNGKDFDFNSNITSNLILEAKWEKVAENNSEDNSENNAEDKTNVETKKYTVTFDSNGGTTVEKQSIEKGAKAVKPTNPTRKGYTFKGWLLNNVEFNFNTAITEDIELKAKWKEEKITVKTPTITEGGRGGDADGSIGLLLKLNSIEGITGIEVYSATAKDGKYTLQKTVKKENWNNETATVHAMKGQHLYFKVRTYVKNTAGTFYSSYSNVIGLDNTLKTPTLSAGGGTKGVALLSIKLKGVYADEGMLNFIDGYELYEKVGNKYTKLDSWEVRADVGETRIFVARVYALNKANEKVYSEYSNEVKLENKVQTPKLVNAMGGPYGGDLNIIADGYYADVENLELIDGIEIYEKVGDKYTTIHTSESKYVFVMTLDAGESKTYVARVYAYNKAGKKVYSEYSNEVKLRNMVVAPQLVNAMGGPTGGTLSIVSEGFYADTDYLEFIDGVEIYEKTGSEYTLVHSAQDYKGYKVTLDVGESKTYVARVYALNKAGKKVYSEYSNAVVLSNTQEQ